MQHDSPEHAIKAMAVLTGMAGLLVYLAEKLAIWLR